MSELRSKCCGAKVLVELMYLYIDKEPDLYICNKCHKPTEPEEKKDKDYPDV